ncbi:MAG: metallophosphoesterase family protein [Thermoproteus sp.]
MLVLSDIHIGSRSSLIGELRRCLSGVQVDVLAIAGDLFEDEHRRVGRDEATRLFRRLLAVLSVRPKMLVASLSSSSHDPIVGHYADTIDGVEVFACNCPISLNYGGERMVITHGDIAVGDGIIAYIIDRIRPGTVGRWAKRKLGLPKDVWLIYGHSHVPYLNTDERILNPGSWKIYGIRRAKGAVYEMPSAKPFCEPDL